MTTPSARAVNRYLLTPKRRVTGKNTTTVTRGNGEHRQTDFVRAALGSYGRALAQFDMAKNIFEHDDGVVDQTGKRQSQSAEHHAVDGLVAGMKEKERGHHRQRNGKKDGRGRSRAAQENQDHQGGEAKADSALAQHGRDGLFDKQGLVKDHMRLQLRRNVAQCFDGLLNAIYYRDGVGVSALLQNRARKPIAVHSRARCCIASAAPSTALPTSERNTDFSPSVLSGTSLRALAFGTWALV